ncbi:hypothetical protein [Piscinibacter gummiphilus]|uniref:Carboxypeptidase regulatory-like domain-containing protein n=1 Tax=Piscinibacter gummiphilus TaxID=946333 RepID=A0ABZ0CX15_9BURK|nr:hypothetical protein [Piscinibacter gummiphilus]WOB09499.1 hypothetical protein RXV79_05420 [Piscinibacter gummiphilus]
MSRRVVIVVSSLLLSLGLTGCLFFGFATVGGTLTGLPSGTSVVLQNNGKDNLTLTQNGRFTFNNTLDDGDDYNVTVLTDPAGAQCTPSNNTGTINSKGDDVENVLVTCTATGNITGTVTGVPAGTAATLLLTLPSSTATLVVSADGNFAFSGIQPNGTHYVVTVQTPPAGRTCTVQNGDANIATGTPTNIIITCS